MKSLFHKPAAIFCLSVVFTNCIWSQITGELPLPFHASYITTDFNRDGTLDYVYADADTIRIVTLNGFVQELLFSITIPEVRAMSAGDIDGDGYFELVLTTYSGIRYIDNNNGVPGNIIDATTGNQPIYGTEIFDYDLDGDGDMLINIYDIDISLLENVGGIFDFEERIFITNTNKEGDRTEMHFCDFNQDGLMDALIYNVINGMLVLINQGVNEFGVDFSFQARNPAGFDTDDYNGDGFPDMFQVTRPLGQDSFEVRIRTNPFGASPDILTVALGGQPNAIDAIDVNEDLIPDVIIADQHSVGVLLSAPGAYTYQLLWGMVDTINFHEPIPYARVNVTDVNDDGLLEIIHSDKDGLGRILTTDWMVSVEEYSCLEIPDPLDCPSGDVVLTRQSEVDSFLLLYPNCTALNGGLSLTGDINDTAPLRRVVSIGGSLHIEQTALETLDPMNIFFVNGNAIVKDNMSLDAVILDELFTVQGDLIIENNLAVQQVNLHNVGEIANNFVLSDHPLLERFETLRALTSVQMAEISDHNQLRIINSFDGYFLNAAEFRLINNPNLDTIDGFLNPNASSDLLIDGCPVIYADIDGDIGTFILKNVTMNSISHFSNVYPYQLILENITGLESLEGLDFYVNLLAISGCPDLERLNADIRVRNLELHDNPMLWDLSGITSTSSGLENLRLIGNASLVSLESLFDIPQITNTLQIEGNATLTDILSLSVDNMALLDSLILVDNPQLAACDAEAICDYLEDFTSYRIEGNATGCHTGQAVRASCGFIPPFGPPPIDDPGDPTYFPMPADDDIWSGGDDVPTSMRLYDHTGNMVNQVCNTNQMNVKEQRTGWYYMISTFLDRIESGVIIIAR